MKRRIYLDHAATTSVLPQAREALAAALERWANPSSPHADGRAARAALEQARETIKAALGWTGHLVFTSGASESAALAFRRSAIAGPPPLISAVEHDAVRRLLPDGRRLELEVGADGLVDPDQLGDALRANPGALVAIQHVNSETGVVQPLDRLAELIGTAGSRLFADCAQSAGKLPLPAADLIALSAHKFGGPPGVGALLVRDLALLVPEGGQEAGYRAGTENLPAILGMAAALTSASADTAAVGAARALLDARLEGSGATIICKHSPRSPWIASYHMPAMSAAAQLVRFDAIGFSISAGSACSSGTTRPSHVLAALGLDPAFAANVVRVSLGSTTTIDDVSAFAAAWSELAGEAARRAA